MAMVFHNPIRFAPRGMPEGIVMRMNPPKGKKMAKAKTAKKKLKPKKHTAKPTVKKAKRPKKAAKPKTTSSKKTHKLKPRKTSAPRTPAAVAAVKKDVAALKEQNQKLQQRLSSTTRRLTGAAKQITGLKQELTTTKKKVQTIGGSHMATKKGKKGKKTAKKTAKKQSARRGRPKSQGAKLAQSIANMNRRLAAVSARIQKKALPRARKSDPVKASKGRPGKNVRKRFAEAGFKSNPTHGKHQIIGGRTFDPAALARKGRSPAQIAAFKKALSTLARTNPLVKNRPVAYSWKPKGAAAVHGGTPLARSPFPRLGKVNPVFGLNQGNIELKTLATDAGLGVVGTIIAGVAQRFVVKDFVRTTVGGQTVIRRNPWAVIWHGIIGVGGGLALRQWGKNPMLRRAGTATAYTTLTYLLTRTGHDLTAKLGFLNPQKTLSDLPIVNKIPLVFGTAANKAAAVTSHQAGALLAGLVTESEKEALLGGHYGGSGNGYGGSMGRMGSLVTSEEKERLLGGIVTEDEKESLLGAYDGVPGIGD